MKIPPQLESATFWYPTEYLAPIKAHDVTGRYRKLTREQRARVYKKHDVGPYTVIKRQEVIESMIAACLAELGKD